LNLLPMSQDVEHRQPVWDALATMFLDTDVTTSREWRAGALAASPYSLSQLEQILIHEVYPVCQPNLRSMAGEWAGFDSKWLRDAILARPASRVRAWFNFGKFTMPRDDEWVATKLLIDQARAKQETAGQRTDISLSQDKS
jgi:hypothetical protein